MEGVGEFVPAAEHGQALGALRREYGLKFQLGHVSSRLWHRLTRRSGEGHALIRIRPAP